MKKYLINLKHLYPFFLTLLVINLISATTFVKGVTGKPRHAAFAYKGGQEKTGNWHYDTIALSHGVLYEATVSAENDLHLAFPYDKPFKPTLSISYYRDTTNPRPSAIQIHATIKTT